MKGVSQQDGHAGMVMHARSLDRIMAALTGRFNPCTGYVVARGWMFIGGEHASDRHALPSKAERANDRGFCTERPEGLRVSCFRFCSAAVLYQRKNGEKLGYDIWWRCLAGDCGVDIQCFCSKDIHAHSTPRSIQ